MRSRRTLWGLALLIVLAVVVGCGTNSNPSDDKKSSDSGGGNDNVGLTQGSDMTIAVVTHGDGGSFWAVAKKGAAVRGNELGLNLN
jgi:simple sugar transport system substrate-binding protein